MGVKGGKGRRWFSLAASLPYTSAVTHHTQLGKRHQVSLLVLLEMFLRAFITVKESAYAHRCESVFCAFDLDSVTKRFLF